MSFIAFGWIAVVVVVVGLVTKPWKGAANRAPLPLALAMAMIAWVIGTGNVVYNDLMALGSWTAASITIGYVPAKAIVFALVAYFFGRTLNTARITPGPIAQRWGIPALLAAVLLYFLGTDIASNREAALERHASSTTLSEQDVTEITQKIRSGSATKDEQGAFLGNPLCPPELLADFAASADPYWRRAVARNAKISPEIAEKLSQDPEQEVRYLLTFNRDLSPAILSRLAADPSERVREMVVWSKKLPDEDYAKLARDPSAKVRETVARQERTSMEDWRRLREDPDQRVRDAARRWDAQ